MTSLTAGAWTLRSRFAWQIFFSPVFNRTPEYPEWKAAATPPVPLSDS
jgi:hypothetical protein